MLFGYARVSAAEQNPDHQVDALLHAGVAAKDIYVDHAGGAKASRPALDAVLRILRDGDTLKITRLDRLGRSVLHLVTLGAELRERGVGLHVTEQVARAQKLYDAGDHTVQQIADLFSVPRTTVYGHLDNASKGKRPAGHCKPKSSADASPRAPGAIRS